MYLVFTTNWGHVNFTKRNNPAKRNYHMSIKKSQAKCTENVGLPVI